MHIDTTQHFWNIFVKYETETLANQLVKFAQSRCSWESFEWSDFEDFMGRPIKLKMPKKYMPIDGTLYHFTVVFIAKCYNSSPNMEYTNS